MNYESTVKICSWIGAARKNQILIWYHGEIEDVQHALDFVKATEENPVDIRIPVLPEGQFLALTDPDKMLIGGYIIDLN